MSWWIRLKRFVFYLYCTQQEMPLLEMFVLIRSHNIIRRYEKRWTNQYLQFSFEKSFLHFESQSFDEHNRTRWIVIGTVLQRESHIQHLTFFTYQRIISQPSPNALECRVWLTTQSLPAADTDVDRMFLVSLRWSN